MNQFDAYITQLEQLIRQSATPLSTIKPAEWTEQNVIMGKPFPGPFRYDLTPYAREIIQCLAPDHPARRIAVMKGAQIGFSSGVIYPGIGWIIKNAPGNTFVTVGAPDLVEKSMEKIDLLIDSSGLRPFIKPSVQRNRANKSGDTNSKKEFSGGYVTVASANNHKAIRQIDLQYGFFDDFESIKSASKESGDTRKMLEQRFAAYSDICKIFYISTPELRQGSNIEAAYLLGDQRKYLVRCPVCDDPIELKFSITVDDRRAGLIWETDNHGHLIKSSVGYCCQSCGGFFDDKRKSELLQSGAWSATATPSQPDFFSYHISALYAPIGMYDWAHYVNDYLEANPTGLPRIERLHQTFVNLCLGETYEGKADAPEAASIQKNNVREYEPGVVPEALSIKDGNGKIVMLTLACDMGGKIDDCRIDYEVVAWSEKGATYSVLHGSIGTFVPRENSIAEKNRDTDRQHWTYKFPDKDKRNLYDDHGRVLESVWPLLDHLRNTIFETDTKRKMSILIGGIDTGGWKEYTPYAYRYLDTVPPGEFMVGLKGDKENKLVAVGRDVPTFSKSRERKDLYLLQVGILKDHLATYMETTWSTREQDQPLDFMNFPQGVSNKFQYKDLPGLAGGLYQFGTFYEHFQSEHRVQTTDKEGNPGAFRWEKKTAVAQNHFWDCRIYNMALRDIFLGLVVDKNPTLKGLTWAEFVDQFVPR